MKTARFVLKIVAASLAGVALVCAVIAYSDKIAALFGRKDAYASEYDDYEE